MKKLILIFPASFFLSFFAQAQYRFYAGLQGGPKFSFSNMVFPGQNQENYQVYRKNRHQEGIVAGYNFPNNRLSLEGGYSRHTHALTLDFRDHIVYGKTPDLWYNFSGDQVSLLGKFTLNKPEAKVRFQAAIGGAYFMKWQVDKANFDHYMNQDRYGYLEFPYAENPDQNFGLKPYDIFGFDASSNIWLVQAGLDTQVSLGNRLVVSLSCIYQSSVQPVETRSFTYSYYYSRGVLYEPEQVCSTISKAEALNINLGIYYRFSKRG